MIEKQKIIIDTDIGDDIDDAFAIAYAMASPELDVLGITTVFKNVKQRAHITKALLCAGGFDRVPVYAGLDHPIKEPVCNFAYESKDENGVVNLRHYNNSMAKYTYQDGSAIDFLLDSADKYPGEITLVAIGPLTNIAVAYNTRPQSFKKFKGIILMNGYFGQICPEWNVMCDPEATRIVYLSGVPIKTVGANCTRLTEVSGENYQKLRSISGPVGDLLNQMLSVWLEDNKRNCVMHDGLALSVLMHDFVKFEKQNITVPLEYPLRGYIVKADAVLNGRESEFAQVDVSIDVDVQKFLESFTDTLIRFTKNQ